MDVAELSAQEAIKHTSNWISQFVFLLSRKRRRRAIYILCTPILQYTAIVIGYSLYTYNIDTINSIMYIEKCACSGIVYIQRVFDVRDASDTSKNDKWPYEFMYAVLEKTFKKNLCESWGMPANLSPRYRRIWRA